MLIATNENSTERYTRNPEITFKFNAEKAMRALKLDSKFAV